MESFAGKRAVVTGGGSGMGRELVVQLVAAGATVATCDVSRAGLAETEARAEAAVGGRAPLSTHVCDVSDEAAVVAFRDEVVAIHGETLELLFNNAGIGGGGSFVADNRQDWERTFAVDWWGVYYCTRAFLPLLMAATEGRVVNTSSVNGFWASLGPGVPHTAYSAAKFAVKGFSEALIEDFRVNAPHLQVSVVMPGHIGTDIVANSRRYLRGAGSEQMSAEDLELTRRQMQKRGIDTSAMSEDDVRGMVKMMEDGFRERAPLDAGGAARIILDGVLAGSWRILVGDDAIRLDQQVRADPEAAYDHTGIGIAIL